MAPSPLTRSKQNAQCDLSPELKRFLDAMKKEIISSFQQELHQIAQSLEILNNKVEMIEQSLTHANTEIRRLDKEVTGLKANMTGSTSQIKSAFDAALEETDHRLARMNSLIIRGLHEDRGSVTDRKSEDRKAVSDILNALNVNPMDVTDVKRLGKPSKNRPRLLCVTFHNTDAKNRALRNSKALKNSEFKNVFLQPDLTPLQREKEWLLRKELKDRRDKGENVVIYGGQVRRKDELKDFQHRF